MKLNKSIILALLILAVSVSGCVTLQDSQSYAAQAVNTGNEELCQELKEPYHVNLCYEMVAIDTLDLSVCDKIIDADYSDVEEAAANISLKTDCYIQLALRMNNLSICSQLAIQDDRDQCYYFTGVVEGFNEDICSLISNSQGIRDLCFKDLAVENKNSVFCDRIEFEQLKEVCLRGVE